jgi:hypothetical protein
MKVTIKYAPLGTSPLRLSQKCELRHQSPTMKIDRDVLAYGQRGIL